MVKKKIAISIDQELYDWLRRQVDSDERTFASMSHAIEYCIAYLKKDREFELAKKPKKPH
jgi:Arc/MetJ-type ribon-helix-helix transcriptional regulator